MSKMTVRLKELPSKSVLLSTLVHFIVRIRDHYPVTCNISSFKTDVVSLFLRSCKRGLLPLILKQLLLT